MRILITGGAGYIGSHVIQAFLEQGYTNLVVVDNLSTGDARNVIGATLIQADIRDFETLDQIFQDHKIEAVCHLAAATAINESIENPLFYYENNVIGTFNVIKASVLANVKHFVYSSTAAIYAPSNDPITENNPCIPTNPYGQSKWIGEQMLRDVSRSDNPSFESSAHHLLDSQNNRDSSHSFNFAILRYFNVAGASPAGNIGQRGPATHLIKNALRTALNQQGHLPIYGTDYDTPDGTCIRDFIHVSDLAMAHVKALEYLEKNNISLTLNCGYGKGYSVRDVVKTVEKIIGRSLPTTDMPRRKGDLPSVIADNSAIVQTLDWNPQYRDLKKMIETAYAFERKIL